MIDYGQWDHVQPDTEGTALALWFNNPSAYSGGLPVVGNYPLSTKVATGYTSITGSTDGTFVYCPKRGYNSFNFVRTADLLLGQTLIYYDSTASVANLTGVTGSPGLKLMLPCSSTFALTMQPNLSQTFSAGRVATALVTIQSKSTSTTSVQLAGVGHVARINDLRDIGVDGPSPTNLQQKAITEKDYCIGVPMQDGIAAVLGSSFNENITPTDETLASHRGFSSRPAEMLVAPLAPSTQLFYSRGLATTTAFAQKVTLDDGPWWLPRTVTVRAYTSGPAYVAVTCAFGSISASGNTLGSVTYQTEFFNVNSIFAPVTEAKSFTFRQPDNNSGFLYMVVSASANCTVTSVLMSVDNIYEANNLGPIVVGSWEDVAAGQNIVVNVAAAFEGLASGSIAPYVKAHANAKLVTDRAVDAYTALYFNPEIQNVRAVFTLSQWMTNGGAQSCAVIKQVVHAGGLFSNLGSSLGAAFGPLGSTAGNLLGGVADSILHTSGMYKRGRDAGSNREILSSAGMLDANGNANWSSLHTSGML